MRALRRARWLIVSVGVLAALLVPTAVLADYPPGPFPGPAPVGAFPVVVVSATVCGAGQVVADDGGQAVTVDVPDGAFAGCTQVTVYGMSGDTLDLLLPAGQTLLGAYAVGWEGLAAGAAPLAGARTVSWSPTSAPLTAVGSAELSLTVTDPRIGAQSVVYRTSGSGLVADSGADVQAGRVSTTLSEPAGVVIATTADEEVAGVTDAPAAVTPTAPANAPLGIELIALIVIVVVIAVVVVGLIVRRRARSAL